MTHRSKLMTLVMAALLGFSVSSAVLAESVKPEPVFLTARGGKLYFGEKEYRAIGINMPYVSRVFTGQMNGAVKPDCSQHLPADSEEKLKDAAAHGFAFVRLFAYPNSPEEIAWYWKNKEAYWQRMDEFFALCRRIHLKVIPSLGMFPHYCFSPYTGEPVQAIIDPGSKTHKLMYEFVGEMVSRYKNDPNILMWEIQNEGLLHADVSFSKERKDILTFDEFIKFYREAATFIKKNDPNHLVTGGDCCPRKESMSLRMGTPGRIDTLREHLSNDLAAQTDPLDVFSIHTYGPNAPTPKATYHEKDADGYELFPGNLRAGDYMIAQVRAAHAANIPVLIGELGQIHPYYNEDGKAVWTCEMIDRLESEGVSLIALWVWRFPEQPQFTFDSKSQPALVQRSAAFNKKYGALGNR